MTEEEFERILARAERAVTGEQPYDLLYELVLDGEEFIFIPRWLEDQETSPAMNTWENEGGR